MRVYVRLCVCVCVCVCVWGLGGARAHHRACFSRRLCGEERDGVSGGSWLLAGIQTWQGKGDRCLPEISGHRWVNGGASLLLQEDPKARGLARLHPEGGTRR